MGRRPTQMASAYTYTGAHMLTFEINAWRSIPCLTPGEEYEQKIYKFSNPEIEMIIDESRLSPTTEENQTAYLLFKLMTYQHVLLLSIYI